MRWDLTAELLVLHARVLLRMPVYQALLVLAFLWILYPFVPWVDLLTWAAFALAVEFVRAGVAKRALPRLPRLSAAALRKELGVFIALDVLAGAAIGSALILFLHRAPPVTGALLEAVLIAIASAGAAAALASRYVVAAYSTTVLVCVAVSWGSMHPGQAPAVAILLLVYWGFLQGVARDAEKLLVRSMEIRHERDAANVELANTNRELEEKNRELGQLNQQLDQARHDRSRILAATSHDLRQPLQALSIFSAVLSANPGPQALSTVGRNIEYIVQNIGDMLDNLVDLARLSSGDYPLRRQPFRLDHLIARNCDAFVAAASAKGLQLTRDLGAPLLLHSDPVAVSRVVRNLLDNAVKYTPSGSVHIALSHEAPHAVLRITDTGPGIDAAQQSRIFEEFYQIASAGHGAKVGGAGLGLAIVKRLCDALNAVPTVTSSPGAGSCFSVSWPEAGSPIADLTASAGGGQSGAQSGSRSGSESGSESGAEATAQAGGRLGGADPRIYVFDDDADVAASLSQLLELWGCRVGVATTPNDAESLLERLGTPSLLIVDLRLADGVDGLSLSRSLRARYGDFPVLMMSAESQDIVVARANQEGVPFLHKPVTSFKLREKIRPYLPPGFLPERIG